MATEIVRYAHRACQAQFVRRRGAVDSVMRPIRMTKAPQDSPSRAPTYMRQWRKLRDLTQEDAAERTGVDRTTYNRIENGKLPYNQDFLERLALAFGCEVGDILTIDPLKPDPPRLVYDRLRKAPADMQQRALAVLEALLREAS